MDAVVDRRMLHSNPTNRQPDRVLAIHAVTDPGEGGSYSRLVLQMTGPPI